VFWTIAVIVGVWCVVILFVMTLMQAASRADEEMARQAWLESLAPPPQPARESSDDLWLA
jgi:N-dimethylarginine dimethylaminohydrolase